MQIEQIRTQIEEGKTLEQQTPVLRGAVVNLAKLNGGSVTPLKVEKVVGFVTEYIEHAPALMMMIEEAAAANGVQPDIQPILDAIEGYFLSLDDVIPDHYGLVGLLDDAYLAHRLIECISDACEARIGQSLLPIEAHEINRFIRRLIGEPFVSILDKRVSATLDDLNLKRDINQVSVAMARMNLASVPDPVWGELAARNIVSIPLEAVGQY